MKVLFVCLGNICRSPAAHGVMDKLVCKQKTTNAVFVDSAGTSGVHSGDIADIRMIKAAKSRSIRIDSISRTFVNSDFDKFDLIIAMDRSNMRNILKMSKSDTQSSKVSLMSDYYSNKKYVDVPDPYYGGKEGFDTVLDLVEEGCANLLDKINKEVVL